MTTPNAKKPAHGATRHQKQAIQCNGCPNTWSGATTCHCGACHRTFSGIGAFDIHRTGGKCNHPATLLTENNEPRLVPVTRTYWSGWAKPGERPPR